MLFSKAAKHSPYSNPKRRTFSSPLNGGIYCKLDSYEILKHHIVLTLSRLVRKLNVSITSEGAVGHFINTVGYIVGRICKKVSIYAGLQPLFLPQIHTLCHTTPHVMP